MLRYKTDRTQFSHRPGNGAGLFLQPFSPIEVGMLVLHHIDTRQLRCAEAVGAAEITCGVKRHPKCPQCGEEYDTSVHLL